MSDPDELLRDVPPMICGPRLVGNEATEAQHLQMLLGSLSSHVSEFEHALALFDYAMHLLTDQRKAGPRNIDQMLRASGWMRIAAKDAAMTNYHFIVTLNAISGRVGLCPSLMPYLARAALKKAVALGNRGQGKSERLRHAVSHSSDMVTNPAKMAKNSGPVAPYKTPNINIPDLSNSFIAGTLDGRRFIATRENEKTRKGELLSIEISTDTLERLKEIQRSVFAAFRPIEAAMFSANEVPSEPE